MDAGLPIVRSLKILGNQQKPGLLKNIVIEVSEDVETGSSFSEALGKHPKTFDKLYVNMVKAGEAGGVLDVILQRLATFMERMEALKRKIIGASIYPAVVITIAVAVVLAIMTFIVPKFEEVFRQVKVPMPGLTVMLMEISNFVKGYWYVIVAFPFVLFFAMGAWGRTKGGRLTIDRMKLHAPLVGPIMKKSVIARFCRTLGTLLQSGVPILEALAIVKNATGNEVVSNAIGTVHDSIREGESIAEPLVLNGSGDAILDGGGALQAAGDSGVTWSGKVTLAIKWIVDRVSARRIRDRIDRQITTREILVQRCPEFDHRMAAVSGPGTRGRSCTSS
jgi:type IV pilus assembly protein PilC